LHTYLIVSIWAENDRDSLETRLDSASLSVAVDQESQSIDDGTGGGTDNGTGSGSDDTVSVRVPGFGIPSSLAALGSAAT